jgi:hypothetical protein
MANGAAVTAMQPPVMGLNFSSPAISLDPKEALILDNLLPKANSGEIRAGWAEHVTGIPGVINTVAAFVGNTPSQSRVFAFNTKGEIYDVTNKTDTPTPIETTQETDGIWDFTNSAGVTENYLCVVSPGGGYWTYSSSEGFKERQITGEGKDKKFKSVFKWKDRLWFIEYNSNKAYYLGIGAIQGDAKEYDFAPVMRNGGYLAYGANWTFDAGFDIDDYLVLVSTTGEVIVYKGTNPDSIDTFALEGVWSVGGIPEGNRCFTQFGGELVIMTSLGVVSVGSLMNGKVINEQGALSSKIQTQLVEVYNQFGRSFGWELEIVYDQAFMLLKTPVRPNNTWRFYIMNVQTGAWGAVTDMPMNCTAQVGSELYFGTEDGRVCRGFVGDSDGIKLDGRAGAPIVCRYMSGFSDFGSGVNLKTFQLARPVFVGADAPRVAAKMLTEYTSPLPTVDGIPKPEGNGDFDTSKWNECVWSGGTNTYSTWLGLQGLGYYGALSIAVSGTPKTQYITTNVTLLQGGVM